MNLDPQTLAEAYCQFRKEQPLATYACRKWMKDIQYQVHTFGRHEFSVGGATYVLLEISDEDIDVVCRLLDLKAFW